MRTDREALIAGIAADPHNDLRKLVFADWLEEHGEPERAEFIRLAAGNRWAATSTEENVERAKALHTQHWRQWFGPFLTALDPVRGVDGFEVVTGNSHTIRSIERDGEERPLWVTPSGGFSDTGFLGFFGGVRTAALAPGSSLDRALRHEPVTGLGIRLADGETRWGQLTGPSLDRLGRLYVDAPTDVPSGRMVGDFVSLTNDPNLSGVRGVTLLTRELDLYRTTPTTYVAVFAASRLASAVRRLDRVVVNPDGLRCLTRSSQLRLEQLGITSQMNGETGRLLASAGFASTLRQLDFASPDENSRTERITAMVVALCSGTRWDALTKLSIHPARGVIGAGAAGLRALANASFTHRLDSLYLKLNNRPDPALVTAVVERLDPGIGSLDFSSCGDAPMPDCFARKFGAHARVETLTDETHGTFWHVEREYKKRD